MKLDISNNFSRSLQFINISFNNSNKIYSRYQIIIINDRVSSLRFNFHNNSMKQKIEFPCFCYYSCIFFRVGFHSAHNMVFLKFIKPGHGIIPKRIQEPDILHSGYFLQEFNEAENRIYMFQLLIICNFSGRNSYSS